MRVDPMRRRHSIDISGTRFAELLASRRRALGMSKVELAEKAAVSGKVIHQIETRSRERFIEKTLLLLAEAVGTPLRDLLEPLDPLGSVTAETAPEDPAPAGGIQPGRTRRQAIRIAVPAIVAVLALTAYLLMQPRRDLPPPPRIELVGSTVHAACGASGRHLWTRAFNSSVLLAEPSNWGDETVLVLLGFDAQDGGRVLLLDGGTGDTIWDRAPDPELAEAAFGEGVLEGLLSFGAIRRQYLDLDGDGVPELAVAFMHMRKFPSSIMALNRSGEVLGEYFSRGHVTDMAAVDLDGDGRQVLICAGNNNYVPYSGGTVFILDCDHLSGATVDSINGGNLDVGDGSLRRIVMPPFDPQMMAWLAVPRLVPYGITPRRAPDGTVTIEVSVGTWYHALRLHLDQDLNPISVRPEDDLVAEVMRWPVENPESYGPNCPQWREGWMQGIIRVDRYALNPAADPHVRDESDAAAVDRAAGLEP